MEAVQQEMAAIGKSLTFAATEVDELLEVKYGGQRTFPVLAMLYPGLDFSQSFHEDHVFPRSRFTAKRLTEAGVPAAQVEDFREAVDRLPNLQLLAGLANIEKQATLPHQWLADHFATDEQRSHYVQQNDLADVPESITDFMTFYEARKDRLRARLVAALGVTDDASE